MKRIRALLPHVIILAVLALLAVLPGVFVSKKIPAGTTATYTNMNISDYYFYLANIRQGMKSDTLFDLYTTEQPAVGTLLFHSYYVILGKIGALLHADPIVMYYAGIAFAILLSYIFCWLCTSLLFPKHSPWRIVAMVIIFFLSPFPQVRLPESLGNIFLGATWWTYMDPYTRLLGVPHHLLGQALMMGQAYFGMRTITRRKISDIVYASILVIAGICLYSLPTALFLGAFGLLTLFQILTDQSHNTLAGKILNHRGQVAILLVGAVAMGLYYWAYAQIAHVWSGGQFEKEYRIYNHRPVEIWPYTIGQFFISYGILPWGIGLSVLLFFKKITRPIFLLLLLFTLPFLGYECAALWILKLTKIRFALLGAYMVGGLLFTWGLYHILSGIQSWKAKRALGGIVGCILCILTLAGWKSYWLDQFSNPTKMNTYIETTTLEAFRWIDTHIPPFERIFTHYYIGNHLPSFASNFVYIGHELGTYEFWKKWAIVEATIKGTLPPEELKRILMQDAIAYMYWDSGPLPKQYEPLFTPIYQTPTITIYRLK